MFALATLTLMLQRMWEIQVAIPQHAQHQLLAHLPRGSFVQTPAAWDRGRHAIRPLGRKAIRRAAVGAPPPCAHGAQEMWPFAGPTAFPVAERSDDHLPSRYSCIGDRRELVSTLSLANRERASYSNKTVLHTSPSTSF